MVKLFIFSYEFYSYRKRRADVMVCVCVIQIYICGNENNFILILISMVIEYVNTYNCWSNLLRKKRFMISLLINGKGDKFMLTADIGKNEQYLRAHVFKEMVNLYLIK